MSSIQGFIAAVNAFIGNTLLPFLFGLALLFFIFNAFRYFVLTGNDEDGRQRARQLALYGIAAFVFLVSIWGIVNMLLGGIGINRGQAVCSDYMILLGNDCNDGFGDSRYGEFGGTPTVSPFGENVPVPTESPRRNAPFSGEVPVPTPRPDDRLWDGQTGAGNGDIWDQPAVNEPEIEIPDTWNQFRDRSQDSFNI